MLVLLIIFMVTRAPAQPRCGHPTAGNQCQGHPERQGPIVVSVDRDGSLYLTLSAAPREAIDADALVKKVSAFLRQNPRVPVLVGGDERVDYGKIYQAMVLLQQAGALKGGARMSRAAGACALTMAAIETSGDRPRLAAGPGRAPGRGRPDVRGSVVVDTQRRGGDAARAGDRGGAGGSARHPNRAPAKPKPAPPMRRTEGRTQGGAQEVEATRPVKPDTREQGRVAALAAEKAETERRTGRTQKSASGRLLEEEKRKDKRRPRRKRSWRGEAAATGGQRRANWPTSEEAGAAAAAGAARG